MTLHEIVDRLGQRGWLARLNTLALALGLIAIGYGLLQPPEHPLMTWSHVSAATAADAPFASRADSDAARAPEAAAFAGDDTRIDAPRACAPDRGITEACIYN